MTKYEIRYSPQSLQDFEEAVNYYNDISPGLGNKFLDDYNRIYKAIELNPFFASVKYGNIRCAAFRKFPFSVHYEINEAKKLVLIIAVFNTWKEPFW
jgi:hypothetical protein